MHSSELGGRKQKRISHRGHGVHRGYNIILLTPLKSVSALLRVLLISSDSAQISFLSVYSVNSVANFIFFSSRSFVFIRYLQRGDEVILLSGGK